MKPLLPFILGMFFLVQSCTGQKPATLKNSTTPRHAVKASCSSMVFDGQVLSKHNILNVFDCSGWGKKYPDLNLAIKNADQKSVDNLFGILNDTFFSTKIKRKNLFEVVADAESRGEMKSLSVILSQGLLEHKALTQLNEALNSQSLNPSQRSGLLKVVSDSNEENLKFVRALKNIGKAYELNKSNIHNLLSEVDKSKLIGRVEALLGDLSTEMDDKSWKHLSGIIHDGDSPIQKWAIGGAKGDLNVLLDVIEEPGFYKDISFLKSSLETGIRCVNRGSSKDFNINIGQELKHKIEGLKNESKESFERTLLHGLTKYLSFQEFCEEENKQQGIKSFYMVLKHAFSVLPSNHDFNFLKRIHQVFENDRFVFLSFLSSKSFSALRDMLIDLQADGRDAQLVRSLYETLGELSINDLIVASQLVNEISLDNSSAKSWYGSWRVLWEGLTKEEKINLISLLGSFLGEKANVSDALNFLEKVLVKFPELTPNLAQNLTDENFQSNIRYVIGQLSDDKTQEQLADFLSNKGLFEFIEIMTQQYKAPKEQIQRQEIASIPESDYVQTMQSVESIQARACFSELTSTYEENASYYNLVNTLPDPCLKILGQVGFVGQIYLWMNSSEAYFKEFKQVDDFHSGTGVWSPGMLQFIFSSAVKADFVLRNKNGKTGILENIDEIHRVVTDDRLLETFHQFSGLYGSVSNVFNLRNSESNLEARLLGFVESKNDAQFNQLTSDTFKLLKKSDPYLKLVIRPSSCKTLSSNLGANPCQGQSEQVAGYLKILRILKRKNEDDKSLIKELVGWIHPSAGIKLPFRKTKSRIHTASIDEIIRFLYDLSSTNTTKSFTYFKKNSSEAAKGTVLDRLEVIIRDIGFLNNFYGAYFKNTVASARDYRKDVIESEKLLRLLEGSGGLFRGLNSLPEDSKHRLKNARQTYDSLIDLSDNYLQPDGSQRTYGPFIQSLLAAIGESSKISTQDFNAYRIPKASVTEGHNGIFLTTIVEMSGLRHLSSFVRARFDSGLSALNTSDFKKINTNLFGRHQLEKIQSALQLVMDRYLDNDRNQLNLIIEDAVEFMNGLDASDQKQLEEIALKAMLLLSDERVSTLNIQKLAQVIELSIEMWPEIREVLLGTQNQTTLLKLLNNFLDSLITNPSELNRIAEVLITSNLLSAQDVRDLLRSKDFTFKLTKFINQLVSMNDFESELNWNETLEAIFSAPDNQWEALKTWFQVALIKDERRLTLSLLISFLGEKNAGEYRLKGIMNELFLNHRPELEQFLSETFKSLEFKPD